MKIKVYDVVQILSQKGEWLDFCTVYPEELVFAQAIADGTYTPKGFEGQSFRVVRDGVIVQAIA